jgi:hypothetical protein
MTLIHMAVIPERVSRQGGAVPACVVDDCFEEDVRRHVWSWTGSYFVRGCGSDRVFLHKHIWEKASGRSVPPGMMVDHINRDKTDNRVSNLRPADKSLNVSNKVTNDSKDSWTVLRNLKDISCITNIGANGCTIG